MESGIARTVWFVLILGAMVLGDDGLSPKVLYDQHRWFELRDAIQEQPVSPLYKGAVAAAFNDRKNAEENLDRTPTTYGCLCPWFAGPEYHLFDENAQGFCWLSWSDSLTAFLNCWTAVT